MKDVNVYWLVNHIIHNWHDLVFYKSEPVDDDRIYRDVKLCQWGDKYYRENKEEIYQWKVSFISVNNKEIKVFIKD